MENILSAKTRYLISTFVLKRSQEMKTLIKNWAMKNRNKGIPLIFHFLASSKLPLKISEKLLERPDVGEAFPEKTL